MLLDDFARRAPQGLVNTRKVTFGSEMTYVAQMASLSRNYAGFAAAGLLQAAVLIALIEGLAISSPPKLPHRSELATLFSIQPPPPPCFDCWPPYPPARLPKLQSPRLRNTQLVSNSDYPAADLRLGNEGTTAFWLDIDQRGRVTACKITASSGFPSLDEASCRLATRRARFSPATDEAGMPIPGNFASRIRWALPKKAPS